VLLLIVSYPSFRLCELRLTLLIQGETKPLCPDGTSDQIKRIVEESTELYTCSRTAKDSGERRRRAAAKRCMLWALGTAAGQGEAVAKARPLWPFAPSLVDCESASICPT
jgi:hypothetical protein